MGRKPVKEVPVIRSFTLSDAALSELAVMLGVVCVIHALALLLVPRLHTAFGEKPQLAAHFVVTLFAFIGFAVYGTALWFSGVGFGADTCVSDHITGFCEGSATITHGMMAFQIYEVLLALWVPKLRGPTGDMLAHHVATLSLASLGAGYGYLHFYAPFFFGLTEISSVPLAFMDLFKFFKPLQTEMPAAFEGVRTVFAAIFLVVRNLYWPYVCAEFWRDSMTELGAAAPRQPKGVVIAFLAANILLTGLQFFWGSKIVKAIVEKAKKS